MTRSTREAGSRGGEPSSVPDDPQARERSLDRVVARDKAKVIVDTEAHRHGLVQEELVTNAESPPHTHGDLSVLVLVDGCLELDLVGVGFLRLRGTCRSSSLFLLSDRDFRRCRD